MAETTARNVQQTPQKQPGILCTVSKTLIISLLLSIVVEWVCIAFVWPEQGYHHSKNVMQQEFDWFSSEFQQSLIYSDPVVGLQKILAFVKYWLFYKTGIQSWLNHPNTGDISMWLFYYLNAYVQSALYVTLTFVIRVCIIVLTSPLFLLTALVGFVDGLVQRDLRRFGVGRESAFKYHHAKVLVFPSMIVAWVIYLSIPFSIYPNLILVPSAFLFGLTISLTSSNFKKYL